jgi:acetyl-CoA acetyltransferase
MVVVRRTGTLTKAKWEFSRKVAAIGSGKHPSGFFPEKAPLELAMYAIKEALDDAGISKDEIDVTIPESVFVDSMATADMVWSRLIEELGIGKTARHNFQCVSGGSSALSLIKVAAGLITTQQAETVLIVHMDRLGTGATPEFIRDAFGAYGIYEEWEFPYGLNYNLIGSMFANRFMHETGTTLEQLASVIVSLRKWANLNPNALLKRELTVDEVLQSKVVAYPATSRMCNIVVDGASAVIMTSAEKAKKLNTTPVYLEGIGSAVTHFSLMTEPDLTRMAYKRTAMEAYENAGVGPEDIDIVEFYDSYPIFLLMQLEEMGFCERGKAGQFVMDGNTSPGGVLPMTTNGGMLAEGHLGGGGGTSLFAEMVRQLRGKCGSRQVEGARRGILTGIGGQYMDSHVSIWGR